MMRLVIVLSCFILAALGLPAERIIGGSAVQKGEIPYQASLQYKSGGIAFSHVCGAAIVSSSWALTAAQCRDSFDLSRYRLVAGSLKVGGSVDKDTQISGLDEFILHPKYRGGVGTNDIALLLLTKSLEWTDAVRAVKLTFAPADVSKTALLSSWGSDTELEKATLTLIANEECAEKLTSAVGSSEPLDATQVCTSGSSKTAACNDDLGSPLVQDGSLVGVMSWSKGPCGNDVPASHTRVESHEDFIREYVQDL